MKLLFKSILFSTFFIVCILAFLPKQQLFFLFEKRVSSHNIIIDDEKVKEKTFGLNISDAQLYYDGMNFSFIKSVDITTLLFYNSININSIRVSKSFLNFLPSKIDNLNIKYSIFDFAHIKIKSEGDFGKFNGVISLFDRKIEGELLPSNLMKTKYKTLLNRFKNLKGRYFYDFRF